MNIKYFQLFILLFITNVSYTQASIKKIVQITEKYWAVDELPEPKETTISYYDISGNELKSENYILDSLVGITITEYDSLNRKISFTRLEGDSTLKSSVTFYYKLKGKSKTLIITRDENNEIFSKEIEKRDSANRVIWHKINYVSEKMKSKILLQYDEKGREIGYKWYDGKRLDFFIIKEYNDQGFVISERFGVEPYGEDNLVDNNEYPKVDEHGNWLEMQEFSEGKLHEKITRIISYY